MTTALFLKTAVLGRRFFDGFFVRNLGAMFGDVDTVFAVEPVNGELKLHIALAFEQNFMAVGVCNNATGGKVFNTQPFIPRDRQLNEFQLPAGSQPALPIDGGGQVTAGNQGNRI